MLKSALRKQALNQRNALTEDNLQTLNEMLLAQFKKLDLSDIKSLHIFLPIIHQKEPDTFLIIDWLQQQHPEIEIVVPKADFKTTIMSHHSYIDKEDLLNNHYHIPEPQKAKPFTATPDMVIVPLLAFDIKGYRVGYGKGFYDRFLAACKPDVIKIGLSFFEAEKVDIPYNDTDIALDYCVTPERMYKF